MQVYGKKHTVSFESIMRARKRVPKVVITTRRGLSMFHPGDPRYYARVVVCVIDRHGGTPLKYEVLRTNRCSTVTAGDVISREDLEILNTGLQL